FGDRLVRLHQPAMAVAGNRADGLRQAGIVEPRLAVRAGGDGAQPRAQGGLGDDSLEAGAPRQGGVILAASLRSPAHGDALVDEGFFDVTVFMSHGQALRYSSAVTGRLPVSRSSIKPDFWRRSLLSCCSSFSSFSSLQAIAFSISICSKPGG